MSISQPGSVTGLCEEHLDLPASAASPEFAVVLELRSFPFAVEVLEEPAAGLKHKLLDRVCIVGLVGDEPALQPSSSRLLIRESWDDQLYADVRCVGMGNFHRKTFAVRFYHPVRPSDFLDLSDRKPPFLAGAKMSSRKLSRQSGRPPLLNVAMPLLHTSSQIPSSSLSCNPHQQVTDKGRSPGISRHFALVLIFTSRISLSRRRGCPNACQLGRSNRIRLQAPSVLNS